jgi:oligopeptide/dipeptide ABC transporter ATP-binding protein
MSHLVEARGVDVVYESRDGQRIRAVRDVDLVLDEGEFVGLVGESGCGKSTLGFALTGMLRPPARLEAGQILIGGTDIASLDAEGLRRQRRHGFAIVLQSGMNALNPVRTIEKHFSDILRAHAEHGQRPDAASVRAEAGELLERVKLDRDVLGRYPHELSGGMRQRVAIAMALSLQPRMIIFDEPTTALDVIVQAAVIETIKELQREQGFTAVLITHDLGVVLDVTDRTMVMYAGRIVEDQPSRALLSGLHHPYTEALLGCYADPTAEVVHLGGVPGAPPDLSGLPAGCSFAPRCSRVEELCHHVEPELTPLGQGRAACHVTAETVRETATEPEPETETETEPAVKLESKGVA